MAGINLGRVIGGGLLAGLVMSVIDGVANGAILGARWTEETKRLGVNLSQAAQSRSLAGWLTFDFLCGIVLLWLYASIRPRYGPGWSPRRPWEGWWRPSRELWPGVRCTGSPGEFTPGSRPA